MFSYSLLHMDVPVLVILQGHVHRLGVSSGCCLENMTGAIDDRDSWQEKKSENSLLRALLNYYDIYIYKCPNNHKYLPLTNHHHHHIALVAQISMTLSRHSSLSFIALGRSSGQHPVSSHSC